MEWNDGNREGPPERSVIEETQAYRQWLRNLRYVRGDEANRKGIEYLAEQGSRGRVFHRHDADPAAHLGDFARFGLASPLQQFWPQLKKLVNGSAELSRRMDELDRWTLIIELPLDSFVAQTRSFADGSHLVQIDSGLFLTNFDVVQLFVQVSIPDPELPAAQNMMEAAAVLELLLAEYRLLYGNMTPKAQSPTPRQGDVIGELTLATNAFALTHEVAHILLRHNADVDDQQRKLDESAADMLALLILTGAYSAGPVVEKPQLYGRLLGARLLFSCIELCENATFVRAGRTHPPAADRWAAVRASAGQRLDASVVADVEGLWKPIDRLNTVAASGRTPYLDVASALAAIAARDNFVGDLDWKSALRLIPLYRLTNVRMTDSGVIAQGRQLAAAAATEFAAGSAISWRALLDLQAQQRPGSFTEQVAVATAAAEILRTP